MIRYAHILPRFGALSPDEMKQIAERYPQATPEQLEELARLEPDDAPAVFETQEWDGVLPGGVLVSFAPVFADMAQKEPVEFAHQVAADWGYDVEAAPVYEDNAYDKNRYVFLERSKLENEVRKLLTAVDPEAEGEAAQAAFDEYLGTLSYDRSNPVNQAILGEIVARYQAATGTILTIQASRRGRVGSRRLAPTHSLNKAAYDLSKLPESVARQLADKVIPYMEAWPAERTFRELATILETATKAKLLSEASRARIQDAAQAAYAERGEVGLRLYLTNTALKGMDCGLTDQRRWPRRDALNKLRTRQAMYRRALDPADNIQPMTWVVTHEELEPLSGVEDRTREKSDLPEETSTEAPIHVDIYPDERRVEVRFDGEPLEEEEKVVEEEGAAPERVDDTTKLERADEADVVSY